MTRRQGLRWRTCAMATVCLFTVSCASYPENVKLEKIDDKSGYRFNITRQGGNTNSLFVILTFSGGGTRAGALAYGVMEKLRATKIRWEGVEKSLLDEVDVISSVSGGSFTSAFYGLYREKLFADRDDPAGFKRRFLYRDLEADLLKTLLNPVNWPRLASPTFGRIDLAAELYDRTIFDSLDYRQLSTEGRPFIMINATDMSKGARFAFTQAQFDFLCSDLDDFKVGRAVAASSNFPVAFTPLTVNIYPKCNFDKPKWIEKAEEDQDYSINPRRSQRARVSWSYRQSKEPTYVHLLDGGVADNIGLRGPLTVITSNDPSWSLPNLINNGKIEKLVVIVVDAKTRPANDFDKSPSPPGLFQIIPSIATVPLDNYSFDTIDLLRQIFKNWRRDRQHLWTNPRRAFEHCPPEPDNAKPGDLLPLDLYAIYVGFDQLENPEQRRKFLNMETSFHLASHQVDALIDIGPKIMAATKSFTDLTTCLRP